MRSLASVLLTLLVGCATATGSKPDRPVGGDGKAPYLGPPEGTVFEDAEYRTQARPRLSCPDGAIELRRWSSTVRAVGCERYLFFYEPTSPGGPILAGAVHPLLGQAPIVFGESIERPVQISGENIQYTADALAHRVNGVWIGHCVIEADGSVSACDPTQPLPLMDAAILATLYGRRYSPAKLHGQAIPVLFTIHLRLRTW